MLAAAQNAAANVGAKLRNKRSTGSDANAFTMEMSVYVDADYNTYMEANGLTTLAEKMDALLIKYQTVKQDI